MSIVHKEHSDSIVPDIEQKLLNLIADLEVFSRQKYFFSELNIFQVAGLYKQEIRHSNVLAFLLRPAEAHGLGDSFLKSIIRKVLENFSGNPPISPLNLALADFSDTLVRREWRNIDILIESKNNNLVLTIENKIGSSEGANQLAKYESAVLSEFPNWVKLYCYLTEEGDPASDDQWTALSYSSVIDALLEARDRNATNQSNEARLIIDHYIDVIRRNIVPDQALIEQCRKLYARHRAALDLVIRYGEVSAFVSAANEFFKEHDGLKVMAIREGEAVFLPITLFNSVPSISGTNWFGQDRPFAFWFYLTPDNRLGLIIEVGPIIDTRYNREAFAKKLLEYFRSTKTITPKYTRVYSEYKRLNEDERNDPEQIRSHMNSLYGSVMGKHLESVSSIVCEFFRE